MAPWLLAALPGMAAGAINLIGNLIGARQQKEINMDMVKWQAEYNSPANQRARYEQAGMNPNLAYGQGTPGNMERPQSVDVQNAWADLGLKFQQSRLLSEQTNLTGSKVEESGIKQELMQAQANVIKMNPMLNPDHVASIVSLMKSTAALKAQESSFMTQALPTGAATAGEAKMLLDIQSIAERLGLLKQDSAIKAEVVNSKTLFNELQKVQVDWMKNKELTPQHIYMGLMLLLQKMF